MIGFLLFIMNKFFICLKLKSILHDEQIEFKLK